MNKAAPTHGTDPIGSIRVLVKMKDSQRATQLIDMAVNAVRGVLRNRGWKVGTVTEFYPKNPNLLGLNVNRGQVIKLRLRSAQNSDIFLEYHDILGTMVHEITHNKISPHDDKFYKLMDELYDEVEGVTSFPFPGGANKLGGWESNGGGKKSPKELMRDAAAARAGRGGMFAGSGQKLGGSGGNLSAAQLRVKALEAAERRLRDSWCQNNVDVEEEEHAVKLGSVTVEVNSGESSDTMEVNRSDVSSGSYVAANACRNDSSSSSGSLNKEGHNKGGESAPALANANAGIGACGICSEKRPVSGSTSSSTASLLRRRYACQCCHAPVTGTNAAQHALVDLSDGISSPAKKFKYERAPKGDDDAVVDLTKHGAELYVPFSPKTVTAYAADNKLRQGPKREIVEASIVGRSDKIEIIIISSSDDDDDI